MRDRLREAAQDVAAELRWRKAATTDADLARVLEAALATPPAPTEDATLDALRQCERRVAEARAAGYREGLRVSAPITESALAEAVPLERPPLRGMLVRDCHCKRVHDHYEELGT